MIGDAAATTNRLGGMAAFVLLAGAMATLATCLEGGGGRPVGARCESDSACAGGTVCRYGRCRPPCGLDRDCSAGELCIAVLDEDGERTGARVCTVPEDRDCGSGGGAPACPGSLVVDDGGELWERCAEAGDCPGDRPLCLDGRCVAAGGGDGDADGDADAGADADADGSAAPVLERIGEPELAVARTVMPREVGLVAVEGGYLAAWIEPVDGVDSVHSVRLSSGGAAEGAPRAVSSGLGVASELALASGPSLPACLAWTGDAAGSRPTVRAAIVAGDSDAITTVEVTPAPGTGRRPSVAAPSGVFRLAWIGAGGRLELHGLDAYGRNLRVTQPEIVASPESATSLAAAGRDVLVGWEAGAAGSGDVWMARLDGRGVELAGSRVQVDTAMLDGIAPSLAWDGATDRVGAAWLQPSPPRLPQVDLQWLAADGSRLGTGLTLGRSASDRVALAWTGDVLAAAWHRDDAGSSIEVIAIGLAPGSLPSARLEIPHATGAISRPGLAWNPATGELGLAYGHQTSGGTGLAFVRLSVRP